MANAIAAWTFEFTKTNFDGKRIIEEAKKEGIHLLEIKIEESIDTLILATQKYKDRIEIVNNSSTIYKPLSDLTTMFFPYGVPIIDDNGKLTIESKNKSFKSHYPYQILTDYDHNAAEIHERVVSEEKRLRTPKRSFVTGFK
ncbi:MAG: hypothetical protein ACOCQD_01920 [archaeon]